MSSFGRRLSHDAASIVDIQILVLQIESLQRLPVIQTHTLGWNHVVGLVHHVAHKLAGGKDVPHPLSIPEVALDLAAVASAARTNT